MRSINRHERTAPPEHVVDKLHEIIRNPDIIRDFNIDRHEEDKVSDEVDYLACFFGVSPATIYRRLKEGKVSIAKMRRAHLQELDVEKTTEVFNLETFVPIVYEWKGGEQPKNSKDHHVVIGIGDLQHGARYNAYGENENPYSYTKRYMSKLKMQVAERFDKYGVPEKICVALLGDLVDGENIYIGQRVIPVQKQVEHVVEFLYDFIQFLNMYDGIKLITVQGVKGNHGRVSKYNQSQSNWDSVVYYVLKSRYEIHHNHDTAKNVIINYSEGEYHKFRFGQWNFVINHGDAVRGVFGSGTSAMNTRPIEQHMESMKLTHFNDMDVFMIGHWHRFHHGELLGMQYVVNGTCYESDFVQTTLMSQESLTMTYVTLGDKVPIKSVELLYLGESQ